MKKISLMLCFIICGLYMSSCDGSDDELSTDSNTICKSALYGTWSLINYYGYEIDGYGRKYEYYFNGEEGEIIYEFSPSEIISYEGSIMADTKIIDWRYDNEKNIIIGTFCEYDEYSGEWLSYGVDDTDILFISEFTGSMLVIESYGLYNDYYKKYTFKRYIR